MRDTTRIWSSAVSGLKKPTHVMLDNGIIQVGIDPTMGGVITWLADSKAQDNFINRRDTGRCIQFAGYADPYPIIYNGTTYQWDWNPTQAGDLAQNASPLLLFSNESGVLHTNWPECVVALTTRQTGLTPIFRYHI